VGSGLILLVIVGAWLAVLVPMALRSHDQHSSARTPEKFGDAMRVLARKTEPRTTLVPRRPLGSRALLSADRTPAAERSAPSAPAALLDRFATEPDAVQPSPRWRPRRPSLPHLRVPALPALPRFHRRPGTEQLSLATRRRRVLTVLLALALVSLLGSVVGPSLLRVVALVFAGLAVLFVVHCRRQAVLKSRLPVRRTEALRARAGAAQAPARQAKAPARRTAAPRVPRRVPRVATAQVGAARVAGVPDRMPNRPAALEAALPAPATRYDEAPAGVGEAWSPVPVPPPTYVGKPVAPPRPRRVLDLTRPGEWTAALDADDSVLADLEDGKDLEVILERRRAVGGW
jgi:hypothetical protein